MSETLLDRLRAALSDRYDITRELGRGGMAVVYQAEDLKHKRPVAIKVLSEALTATLGNERFLREIEVVAKLQHPNVLTLIDSGDVEGHPYYVMPFVEGQSLRDRLNDEGTLPLDDAVRIAIEIADALDYAHQHDIVHRDIKPANILLSQGHAVAADFGIATAVEYAAMSRMTQTGISLGSPTYMSPEQAAGERDLDGRTDIYSLGCVLYEMLTGEPPFADASLRTVVTKKLVGEFKPVRELRGDVPAPLNDAIGKALATEPEDRFATAGEFAKALSAAVVSGAVASPAARRRSRAAALVGTGIAVAAVVGVITVMRNARAESERVLLARAQLADVQALVEVGDYVTAEEIAEQIDAAIPGDTTLTRLWSEFSTFVPILSDPPGARVSVWREDRSDAGWQTIGVTPLDSVRFVDSGVHYRVRIELDGYRTAEFLPNAFAPWAEWRGRAPVGTVTLDRTEDLPEEMVRLAGFVREDTLVLGDYLMDRFEVSNRQYKEFVDAGGYSDPRYWQHPIVIDGREVSLEEAAASLEDQTGRPGPSTWRLGSFPEGQEDYPVGGVSWYEAAAYAEFVGKELPTADHWLYGSRYHREASWVTDPRSNMGGEGPRPVGEGDAMSGLGIYDLVGNVREWVVNEVGDQRATRGAAWDDPQWVAFHVLPKGPMDRSPTHGIRLVRYLDSGPALAHLKEPVDRTDVRDYRAERPASASEFEIYRRLYDYDAAPIDALVERTDTAEHWVVERVGFEPPYTGLRSGAYVFVPRDVSPPLQPVIVWPGSGALNQRDFDPLRAAPHDDFLVRSGRAVVLPLYLGTFERDDPDNNITHGDLLGRAGSNLYRDYTIAWVKDLKRTIDYLETRDDMDMERVSFYGASWGGQAAPIALAVEPRIKVAALYVAGLWTPYRWLPEVDPLHFLPHVTQPVIMINGEFDIVFPLETAQEPFFDYLGTDPEHKRHLVYPLGHGVPRDELITETLDWLDTYLGPPGS